MIAVATHFRNRSVNRLSFILSREERQPLLSSLPMTAESSNPFGLRTTTHHAQLMSVRRQFRNQIAGLTAKNVIEREEFAPARMGIERRWVERCGVIHIDRRNLECQHEQERQVPETRQRNEIR